MNRTIFPIKAMIIASAAVSFSSCLVSSRSSVDVFNKEEYANTVSIKTIRVPMLITKPAVKNYLKFEEDIPREIIGLMRGLKKIRVTLAHTINPKLINDFRTSISRLSGEEWLSVHNGSQWILLKGDQNNHGAIKRIRVAVSLPEASQLVYVNMKCNLTPRQLSQLINFAMHSEEGKKFLKEQVKD